MAATPLSYTLPESVFVEASSVTAFLLGTHRKEKYLSFRIWIIFWLSATKRELSWQRSDYRSCSRGAISEFFGTSLESSLTCTTMDSFYPRRRIPSRIFRMLGGHLRGHPKPRCLLRIRSTRNRPPNPTQRSRRRNQFRSRNRLELCSIYAAEPVQILLWLFLLWASFSSICKFDAGRC